MYVMEAIDYAHILMENYGLGELEERLEATLPMLAEGLVVFVEENYFAVEDMLKEDLYV